METGLVTPLGAGTHELVFNVALCSRVYPIAPAGQEREKVLGVAGVRAKAGEATETETVAEFTALKRLVVV